MWYISKAPLMTALFERLKISKKLKIFKKSVDKQSKMWYSIKVADNATIRKITTWVSTVNNLVFEN